MSHETYYNKRLAKKLKRSTPYDPFFYLAEKMSDEIDYVMMMADDPEWFEEAGLTK